MANLLLVADGAYPHSDYDFLPAHVTVWAGYLGGHTPHAWSAAEVAHLEATGRAWWGIWTAPDRQAINAGQGAADAADTIAVLAALRYPTIRPVFYDVEYGTWHADPAGAEAAATRWKHDVAAAGWTRAYWYGPLASHCDWVANWTGFRPAVLPPGRIGVQYDHALSNDRYDISVFDPSILEATMALDPTDRAFITNTVHTQAVLALQQLFSPGGEDFDRVVQAVQKAIDQTNVATGGEVAAVQQVVDAVKVKLDAAGPVVAGTFTITGTGHVGTP